MQIPIQEGLGWGLILYISNSSQVMLMPLAQVARISTFDPGDLLINTDVGISPQITTSESLDGRVWVSVHFKRSWGDFNMQLGLAPLIWDFPTSLPLLMPFLNLHLPLSTCKSSGHPSRFSSETVCLLAAIFSPYHATTFLFYCAVWWKSCL